MNDAYDHLARLTALAQTLEFRIREARKAVETCQSDEVRDRNGGVPSCEFHGPQYICRECMNGPPCFANAPPLPKSTP